MLLANAKFAHAIIYDYENLLCYGEAETIAKEKKYGVEFIRGSAHSYPKRWSVQASWTWWSDDGLSLIEDKTKPIIPYHKYFKCFRFNEEKNVNEWSTPEFHVLMPLAAKVYCENGYEPCLVQIKQKWEQDGVHYNFTPGIVKSLEPDVVIVVKDDQDIILEEIPVHKRLLVYNSDTFKSFLNDGNGIKKNQHEIVIRERSPEAVRDFIDYLYTNQIDFSKNKRIAGWIRDIALLASDYLIDSLNARIRTYLIETLSRNPESYFQVLAIAALNSDVTGLRFQSFLWAELGQVLDHVPAESWVEYLNQQNIESGIPEIVHKFPILPETALPLYRIYRNVSPTEDEYRRELHKMKLVNIAVYMTVNADKFTKDNQQFVDFLIENHLEFDSKTLCQFKQSLSVEDRAKFLSIQSIREKCN